MIETEKKFHLTKEQFDQIRKKLADSKIYFGVKATESNIIYKKKVNGTVLRVRENVIAGSKPEYILTHKGEAIMTPDGVKTRIELESKCDETIYEILAALGHTKRLVYEKNRETFYPGAKSAIICLDELPFGYYMEIEGDVEEIKFAENFIGMDLNLEIYSYPTLTKIYGKSEEDGLLVAKFNEQDRRMAANS